MLALLFPLFIRLVLTAPQGYNYQPQAEPAGNIDLIQQQYLLLQQYAHQQLHQPQQQQRLQSLPQQTEQQQEIVDNNEVPTDAITLSKNINQAAEDTGYEFANQLVQQAQQLVQYEQQQQQQQQQQKVTQQLSTAAASVATETTQKPDEPAIKPVPISKPELILIKKPKQPHTLSLSPPAPRAIVATKAIAKQETATSLERPPRPTQNHYNGFRIEPQSQSVQYNKEFFFHAAPQEEFDPSQSTEDILNQLKKNLRVVFIKAPEQNALEKAALQLAKQTIEQQTAIYVLTKQHDVQELANKFQDLRAGTQAKPEVVFVKYKTPEEAEQAQRTIQAQYENLDGPNNYNHGVPAQTHSFIDALGINPLGASGFKLPSGKQRNALLEAPHATYLPTLGKY